MNVSVVEAMFNKGQDEKLENTEEENDSKDVGSSVGR